MQERRLDPCTGAGVGAEIFEARPSEVGDGLAADLDVASADGFEHCRRPSRERSTSEYRVRLGRSHATAGATGKERAQRGEWRRSKGHDRLAGVKVGVESNG
jgi:hypothetical protein